MSRWIPLVVVVAACAAPSSESDTALARVLRDERAAVERWFGAPFLRDFAVEVSPDRAAFDRSLPAEWGIAPSQCWMVACGVGDALRLIEPSAWSSQACEHDPQDAEHVRGIVAHELVHVFHGQRNPSSDFSATSGIDWFVEGLAVLASGQLEDGHMAPASEAIALGKAPAKLANAWSGKYRYAVCGTLVGELELRCGRAKLLELLASRTNEELLALAQVDEAELLASWRRRHAKS